MLLGSAGKSGSSKRLPACRHCCLMSLLEAFPGWKPRLRRLLLRPLFMTRQEEVSSSRGQDVGCSRVSPRDVYSLPSSRNATRFKHVRSPSIPHSAAHVLEQQIRQLASSLFQCSWSLKAPFKTPKLLGKQLMGRARTQKHSRFRSRNKLRPFSQAAEVTNASTLHQTPTIKPLTVIPVVCYYSWRSTTNK